MSLCAAAAVRKRAGDGGGAPAETRRQLLPVSVEHGQPGGAAAHLLRTLGRRARVRLAPAGADSGARYGSTPHGLPPSALRPLYTRLGACRTLLVTVEQSYAKVPPAWCVVPGRCSCDRRPSVCQVNPL